MSAAGQFLAADAIADGSLSRSRAVPIASVGMQLLDLHEEGLSPLDRAAGRASACSRRRKISRPTPSTLASRSIISARTAALPPSIFRAPTRTKSMSMRDVSTESISPDSRSSASTDATGKRRSSAIAPRTRNRRCRLRRWARTESAHRAERRCVGSIGRDGRAGLYGGRLRGFQGRRFQRAHATNICARAAQADEARRRIGAGTGAQTPSGILPARREARAPHRQSAARNLGRLRTVAQGLQTLRLSGALHLGRRTARAHRGQIGSRPASRDGARTREQCHPAREVAARNRSRALREMEFQCAAGGNDRPTTSSSRRSPRGSAKKPAGWTSASDGACATRCAWIARSCSTPTASSSRCTESSGLSRNAYTVERR